MEKNQKIIIVAIFLSLIVLCSGLTYAYFTSSTTSESGSTIVAKGGQMNIKYTNGSGNITLSNIYPRSIAWANKNFTITGNNTTNLKMYYSVSLVVDNNNFDDSYLSYTLTGNNPSKNGNLIPTISDYQEILSGAGTYELGIGSFDKSSNINHTYTFKIFFLETNKSQNNSQEAYFAAHLIINPVNQDGSISYSGSGRNATLSSNSKLTSITRDFEITSNENAEQSYAAKLIVDENTYSNGELKYNLAGTNKGNNGEMIENASNIPIPAGKNQEILLGTGKTLNTTSLHQYKITINANNTQSLADNYIIQNQGMLLATAENIASKKIKVRIEIKNTSHSLSNRLLKKGVKDNPLTTIGTPATTDEGLIKNTDDYGTTYYYRGNVKNNYVQFAEMCWRIVRITGDGSIKLILQNNDSIECTSQISTTAALRLKSDTSAKKYQNGINVAYSDFPAMMYGEKMGSIGTIAYNDNFTLLSKRITDEEITAIGSPTIYKYSELYKNTYKNNYVTILEQWYQEKLSDYKNKLADIVWCNDKYYNTSNHKFAAYDRLTANTPSFICRDDNLGGKLSKYTVSDTSVGNAAFSYPIGLLTADELMFAGLTTSTNNYNNYLVNDGLRDLPFVTMTPVSQEELYRVYDGTIYATHASEYLRPSIALKSDIFISSGTGTSSDPYIVE